MTIEPEVALRAMLRAMQKGLPAYPVSSVALREIGKVSDSEAEQMRALLRHHPLPFYGELEDQTLQRMRWMI